MAKIKKYGRKSTGSSPCKKKGCGNTVSKSYPTYPYCWMHANEKNAAPDSSMTKNYASQTPEQKKRIRNSLYNPKKTLWGKKKTSAESFIHDNPGFSPKNAAVVLKSWASSTHGVNMSIPSQANQVKNKVLHEVKNSLQKSGVRVNTVDLHGGSYMTPDGDNKNIRDHECLLVEDDTGGKFIVDVATSAPFVDLVGDGSIEDYIGSGSPSSDGLSIGHVAEYGLWSDKTYKTIIDENGEMIWDNRTDTESDVEYQRKVVRKSPPIKVEKPVYYQTSRDYGFDEPEDKTKMRKSRSFGNDQRLDEDEIIDKLLNGEEV